jgi:type I restriction enzyme S subunit
MTFKEELVGKYFSLTKGLGYLGKYLQESNVGLIGLNSFEGSGGYKRGGEKQYSGPYKPEHVAKTGDLFISTTDITQDGRVLASPLLLPDLSAGFETVIYSGDIVKAVPRVDGLRPEFLYNILRVKSYREKAAYASTGTTVRRIPIDVIENLAVPVPSLQIQEAINQLISRIDEKIWVNSKISTSLESIAYSIFKSWFIDFDPVKAKMAGEIIVGMADETAALFPDVMEDSENGQVPQGWTNSPLRDFAVIRNGAPFASKTFNETKNGLPLIRIRDLKSQRSGTWCTENHPKGFTVHGGQLLIGMDGEFNPTLWSGEESLVNQRICLLENVPSVSSMYLYFALIPVMKRIENGAIGTTVIHLGKSDIDEIQLLNPGTQLLKLYRDFVEPFLREIVLLAEQSRNLESIRDSLLPRLISGELQIPAEMLVA